MRMSGPSPGYEEMAYYISDYDDENLLVIAPLSCISMAKMTMGIADNLLLSVVRAWDTTGDIEESKQKRIVVAAMNTAMWEHLVTKKQLKVLEEEWGLEGERRWMG